MDTLTHGLLGAVVAALPLSFPRVLAEPGAARHEARAVLLACVLAAELPDLDYLVPAADSVLHTLRAHRGPTHALLFSPLVALAAAAIAKLVFREVRFATLYVRALLAVPIAHLLPDLWTGWGTRLFLPFSDRRAALDWTMVIDPLFTLPLAAGAVWALASRSRWRRALSIGAAIAAAYLLLRIALATHLTGAVHAEYAEAAEVHVFPAPLSVFRWRYVAELEGVYAAGSIALGGTPEEESRLARTGVGALPPAAAELATVREALAWARFPIVRVDSAPDSAQRIEIADLRYHLRGRPTLAFVITVNANGELIEAELQRGGSARELLRRWWRAD